MNLIIILLYVLSFVFIWQFVGYPLLMGIVTLKSKPENKDYAFQPFVSILVPTYNEEKVIENSIITSFEERVKKMLVCDYTEIATFIWV